MRFIVFLRNGKPKPPTVTGVFLFAKMMITINKSKIPSFQVNKSIFDGWENGNIFGERTIAIYAFVCFMGGAVNKDDIKKAFDHLNSIEIESSLIVLRQYGLITIENQ